MENSNHNDERPENDWPSKNELEKRNVDTTDKTPDNGGREAYDSMGDERERLMFADNRKANKNKESRYLSDNHDGESRE